MKPATLDSILDLVHWECEDSGFFLDPASQKCMKASYSLSHPNLPDWGTLLRNNQILDAKCTA